MNWEKRTPINSLIGQRFSLPPRTRVSIPFRDQQDHLFNPILMPQRFSSDCKKPSVKVDAKATAAPKGTSPQNLVRMDDDVVGSNWRLDGQEAMKNDAFLPSDDSSSIASSSEGESQGYERACPCCKQKLRLSAKDFHFHLVKCLRRQTKVPTQKAKSKDTKACLGKVQNVIGKLDLTFRINIMESLYRMAKNTDSSPIFPQLNKEEVENKVLSLIYGKKQERKSVPPLPKAPRVVAGKKRRRGRQGSEAIKRDPRIKGAKLQKLQICPIQTLEIPIHTPPVSASRIVNRRFSPLALEDVFHLPRLAVPQKSDDFDWKKHILSWQENNRAVTSATSISLPNHPF
mmetsp:Transcript_1408/g.2684  ORF Transcript_1408/g.2684 Transcript_1408/m.2684 type:complete len:344 (+) Transcript_1408:824-1855(+)|eukprot:CAMPEP_0167832980 /NCGR_PEP_ID=MMETSP0112_2-20121227/14711_1 /TAXON_ID=91324 /ORGANISM="Lotharella globosa, Strain CCCM811" /LENGTH=343 /DNA_ID=CAMNT_0007738235 /DNA_START=817 /DNA_END=1848 /DNA_ORIENTATION=+